MNDDYMCIKIYSYPQNQRRVGGGGKEWQERKAVVSSGLISQPAFLFQEKNAEAVTACVFRQYMHSLFSKGC